MYPEEHQFLYHVPQGTFFGIFYQRDPIDQDFSLKDLLAVFRGRTPYTEFSLAGIFKGILPNATLGIPDEITGENFGSPTDIWVVAKGKSQLAKLVEHGPEWANATEGKQMLLELETALNVLKEIETRHPFYNVPNFGDHFECFITDFTYSFGGIRSCKARMKTEGAPGFWPWDIEARLRGYTPEVLSRAIPAPACAL